VNADLLETAKALPLPERIELVEALWDSITSDGYEPPVTPAQTAELQRRFTEHRDNPQSAVSWEKVKADLDAKFAKLP
jgi:putative addiction module component (TIGR02574 family)